MKTTKNISFKTTIKKKTFTLTLATALMLAGCKASDNNFVTDVSTDVIVPQIEVLEDDKAPILNPVSTSDDTSIEKEEVLTASVNDEVTPSLAPPSIRIIMVGDILLHTPLEEYYKQPDGSYDYTNIFANTISTIESADLALVNQEVIIGGEELGVSGYPCFNAPYSIGDELIETGFDVICHGTNHAMDKGRRGITNCLDFWHNNYPNTAVLGIYDSAESRDSIYIYENAGMKIAILNYTYGTNGIELPADMPYAVNLLKESQVRSDIAFAEANADFTIVCPHWGTEYRLTPDSMQQKWTDIFLQEGVDLVLGTHPHVIEPVEMVTDEQTGHNMLVYYSLGNYINWTGSSGEGVSNRMVGGMSDVTLSRDSDGQVSISDYGVHALVSHLINETNGPTTYFLSDYSDSLASQNAILSQDASFSYDYCVNLCNEVWGEKWD